MSNEGRYYDALRLIARSFKPAGRILREDGKDTGLTGPEELEMAYDNIQQIAAAAIKGQRRPKA